VAAVGLAVSPLFWSYGVVGLSYTTEAALATTVAALIWPMARGGAAFAGWSALALGLAGGVRQSLLPLLFPLWLGMAWRGSAGWRAIVGGLGILGLVTAAWLLPMLWLAGGPTPYLQASRELFESTVRATTLVGEPGALRINATALAEALILGVGVLLPALVATLLWHLRRLPAWEARDWFFAGWIVPPLLVYVLFHFGQYGYLLTILPAIYILLARGVVVALADLRAPRLAWMAAMAVLVATTLPHTLFFARAPAIDVPGVLAAAPGSEGWWMSLRARYRFRLWPTTAPGLLDQERVLRGFLDGVRSGFDPSDTVLLTELGNPRSYPWFRHVGYYLPEFPVYHLRVGRFSPGYLASRRAGAMSALDGPEIVLPASTRRLVWVVDHWNPILPRPPGLREQALPRGRWLYILDVDRRPVEHGGYRLTPLTAVARVR